MSSIVSTTSIPAALPAINPHAHGHKKGVHAESSDASLSSTSQPQSTPGLFSSLLQTLEEVVGTPAITSLAATAASAVVGATTAALTGNTVNTTAADTTAAGATSAGTAAAGTASAADPSQQNVQQFLQSLFQTLKADGLGGTSGAASAATPSTHPSTNVAKYEGSLASSLQTLIQQVGSGASSTSPSVANLTASFDTLVKGTTGTAANAGGGSTRSEPSSNASLQSFLNTLLQTVQAGGSRVLSSVGSHVDTNV